MLSKNNTKPFISVAMISYNQEEYVAQAIEGVLSQQTNFSYEFIISDDNSIDNTASIIKKYQKNFPEIIAAKYNGKNIGMMANMVQTLNDCKGEFVAILEADDYWIEPTKLQKQIDFLLSRPELSFCFHNAIVISELEPEKDHLFTDSIEGVFNSKQLLKKWEIPTASVVFRNNLITWPSFTFNCVQGDILLFLLLLEEGEAFAFPQAWSVYRKNRNSYTALNFKNPVYLKKVVEQLHQMKIFFPKKYEKLFKNKMENWKLAYLLVLLETKKIFPFIRDAFLFMAHHPGYFIRKGIKIVNPNRDFNN